MKQYLWNSLLSLWLLLDSYKCLEYIEWSLDGVIDLLLGVGLLWAGIVVLFRAPPVDQNNHGGSVAIISVFWSYLFVLLGEEGGEAGSIVRLIASALIAWSMYSLGANFSVFPQRRTIVVNGPYRLVRHPLYFSYLLFDCSYIASDGRGIECLVWLGEVGLLWWRIRLEERCLMSDISYARYCGRVRWRFFPYIV